MAAICFSHSGPSTRPLPSALRRVLELLARCPQLGARLGGIDRDAPVFSRDSNNRVLGIAGCRIAAPASPLRSVWPPARPPEAQARIRGARRGASSPRRVSESGHRLGKTRTHGARSNRETAQACEFAWKAAPPRWSKGKSRAPTIRGGTQTINLCQYIRGQSDHGFPCAAS